ncbi:MAG: acetoacetate--CoA ligase [Saprospiraceae bacterium]
MPNHLQPLWQPSESFQAGTNLRDFENWLQQHYQLRFDDYPALWQWSVDQPEQFWQCCWEYFDIITHTPWQQVLSSRQMPGARWFEGATLNYAEHLFRHRDDSRPALIFQNEHERNYISWATLAFEAAAMQRFLVSQGIRPGDRVAAYLPNIPQAISCFMAVNAMGAIWSCCSPDFGVDTVIERFEQIQPSILIAADGYQYNGKTFLRLTETEQIRSRIPSLKATVLIRYQDTTDHLDEAIYWSDVLAQCPSDALLTFTPVPFEHPIWVLYSSGTTGRPKAITHSHGGVLLEHLRYMAFHNDVHPGEHFFWFTTTGWMMWNFLQASMLMGAVPVLYDGSPGYPSMDVLWKMAAELPVHHFGTSAPYLTACMRQDLMPQHFADLSALRSIGSTGAPLPAETFRWVYSHVGKHIWLCSMSGGTDVCTAFVGGNPYAPVYEGFIQCRTLGTALYAYNAEGERLIDSLGEMVIETPMPSMPIYFWNDPDGSRYQASYFDTFPGKWRHGDWIRLREDGQLTITGRSDATLNRKGIRIGTAEIYSVLEKIPAIRDSLVLNIELDNGDDLMPLFITLEEVYALDDTLSLLINNELRTHCSPRHVPDSISAVPDIPYTLSGKKMEVPVKKILMGMDVGSSLNRDAVRNPAALDYFIQLAKK